MSKLANAFLSLSMVVKFTLWSVVLLVIVGYTGVMAIWNNQNASTPDYVYWQDQYKDIAFHLAATEAVKEATQNAAIEVKQATVLQFPLIEQDGTTQQRVDRCTSCHAGLANPQMTAENIIRIVDKKTIPTEQVADYLNSHPATLRIVKTLGAHPGVDIEGAGPADQHDLGVIHGPNFTYGIATERSLNSADTLDYAVQKYSVSQHPFATFGCTTCHYGSGRELIQDNAHGIPEHWLAPLLPAKYMDAACAQCHIQYNSKTFHIGYLNSLQIATFTVTGDEPVPQGTVSIYDGNNLLGSGGLVNGTTRITYAPPVSAGEHNLTVTYSGDLTSGYASGATQLADLSASPVTLTSPGAVKTAAYTNAAIRPVQIRVSEAPVNIPMMTTIARGEQLFHEKACYGCHKIDGFSKGNVGPELTYEGRLAVPSTIAHQIWDPRYKVNSCVMPYFFSYRLYNTDRAGETLTDARGRLLVADLEKETVDPRAPDISPANIADEDTRDSLLAHGYIPDVNAESDVDALVTFVSAQTGQNYAGGQADRMSTIAAFNVAGPPTVPATAAEGKLLFEGSGCYACHYIGDPKYKGLPFHDPHGQGGITGPELTWEGSRHSTEWLIEHYKDPQAFVPGSVMPIFPFSDSQREALSLYDQTLMPDNPAARPVTPDQDMPAAGLAHVGAQTPDIRYMVR
ncbi:MAG: Ig-like domain repeat protein [Capsulimonadaceae bacterium]